MAVQDSRERSKISSFPALGWCKPGAPSPLLSLEPRVPPPGGGAHIQTVQPRPPGSGAHTHAHTHTRKRMSTPCCSSKILLLLQSATGSSICTTDVMTQDPGGNRGPSCFSEGRPDSTEGSASRRGFAGHEAERGITWRGLGEKPCKLPLGALGNEMRLVKCRGVSPPPGELRRKGRGGEKPL